MAIGYNPSAISQGLVLALDAANSKSYPGSGTTWFDMSGNSNNGSLVNAPAFTFSSVYFDGNGDYLQIASNAALAPGTGDFTIEGWINFDSLPASNAIAPLAQNDAVGSSSNDKFWFGLLNNAGTYELRLGRHSTSTGAVVNWTPTTGVWYHIAAVRYSGNILLFINGVSQTVTSNTTFSGVNLGQGGFAIGAISTPYYLTGYISNLRYVVGTAVYTTSFSPIVSPLNAVSGTQILTCKSNTITDGSSNAFAITVAGNSAVSGNSPFRGTTSYSANALAFDGTDDYVTVPDSASTNTFSAITLEMVVKYTSTSNQIFAQKWNYGINAGYGIEIFSSSIYGYAVASAGTYAIVSVSSYPANRIYHMALTMSGSTQTLYINGTSVASNSGGGIPSFGGYDLRIGGRSNGSGGNDSKFTGTMYYTKLYNQALTLSQVQQNYNALRGRYGI